MVHYIPETLNNPNIEFNVFQYKPLMELFDIDETGQLKQKNNRLLIADETGLGKTIEAGIIITEMYKINPDLHVLIICPPKLRSKWKYNDMRNKFDFYFEDDLNYYADIISLSYFENKNDFNINEQNYYDLVIVDEAHKASNPDTNIHKNLKNFFNKLQSVRNNATFILMTATPVVNEANDIKNLLSLTLKTPIEDINEYIKNYPKTTSLQAEAYKYEFKLKKELICVDLEESEQDVVNYIMDESTKFREKGFLKHISSSSLMSLKYYIHKNANFEKEFKEDKSNFLRENTIEKNNDENQFNENENYKKLEELLDKLNTDTKFKTLRNCIDNTDENKIIVFSSFIITCKYLSQELRHLGYNVYTITGDLQDSDVSRNLSDFKLCEKKAILICSNFAKEGFDMQFCSHIIHYDFPYTPAAIGQRNGRIYRNGQKSINPVSKYLFVNKSYDYRLYFEIIFSKFCQIKELSEYGWVSEMAIMDDDINTIMDLNLEEHKELEECLRTSGDFKETLDKIKQNKENPENFRETNHANYNKQLIDFIKFLDHEFNEEMIEQNSNEQKEKELMKYITENIIRGQ